MCNKPQMGTTHGLDGERRCCNISSFWASVNCFLRPRRLAPARTPSDMDLKGKSKVTRYEIICNWQGGSVTIASNKPPHRHGWWVRSNTDKSIIRDATPYWDAARITPGVFSRQSFRQKIALKHGKWDNSSTFPSHLTPVNVGAKNKATEMSCGLGWKNKLIRG